MKFNIYTESQVLELKNKIVRLEREIEEQDIEIDTLMNDLILYKIEPYYKYEEE